MKNIFILIALTFASYLHAQEGFVVPLQTLRPYVANGTYIKDIDNVFNPFIGTYVGYWNNKKFTLVVQKREHVTHTEHNGDYYYEDRMVGKYEIANDVDNTVLYTTMEVTEYDDFPILDLGNVQNGELEFDFSDSDERCHNGMQLRLYGRATQGGVTTVKYWGRGDDFYLDLNCTYTKQADIPKVLPYGFLTLTKVE